MAVGNPGTSGTGTSGSSSAAEWEAPWPYGLPDAFDSAGTVAAPLLAGFSFSLIALTVPGTGIKWPALTQAFFIVAGLLFIAAVQAGFWARQWSVKPSDLDEWRPNDSKARIHAEQRMHFRGFEMWSSRLRLTYRLGILSLLSGVVFLVVPPGRVHGAHWVAIAAASIGWLFEVAWIGSGWILKGSPVSLYTGQVDAPKAGTPLLWLRSSRALRWLARKAEPLVTVDP